MRTKLIAVLAALAAVVCLGFVLGSSSASAAPTSSGTPYPPPSCPLLTVSTTTPFPGQTITVAGTNFTPGVAVTIELDTSVTLAHVHADGSGDFSVGVKLPDDLVGNHVIRAVGTGLGNCPVDPIQIRAQGSAPSSSSNGGGLASTGVDILTGVIIALGLIAAGLFATRTGRRREAGRHSA